MTQKQLLQPTPPHLTPAQGKTHESRNAGALCRACRPLNTGNIPSFCSSTDQSHLPCQIIDFLYCSVGTLETLIGFCRIRHVAICYLLFTPLKLRGASLPSWSECFNSGETALQEAMEIEDQTHIFIYVDHSIYSSMCTYTHIFCQVLWKWRIQQAAHKVSLGSAEPSKHSIPRLGGSQAGPQHLWFLYIVVLSS